MLDKGLLKLLGGNMKYVIRTMIVMLFGMFSNIGVSACIVWTVYITVEKGGVSSYLYPAAVAALCLAVRYICTRVSADLKNTIGSEAKKDLRKKTYDKILSLGVRGVDGMSMAGLTQVSMEGIEQLDLYFSTYLPQFFYSMAAPFILFFICLFIQWKAALVLLCCVPLIPMAIVAVSKWAKKIFAKYWDKYTSMGDTFLDSVQGLTELKIYKADVRQHEYINKSAEEFREITMKVLVMQLSSITIMDLVAFGGSGLGIAAAIAGISGAVDTAGIMKALFMVLVAVEFFLPLRALGTAFHVAMNGATAGKKILTILGMPDPVWGEKEVTETGIEFKNVSFSYDGERKILRNVTAEFPENSMTAIVGESGCGKSTMVSLITGSIVPEQGEVLLGGEKITGYSEKGLFENLAVVSTNSYIFNDTVFNNFRLANENITEEKAWDYLREVNLEAFVRENGGLQKVISEDGSNISGGQKQRLVLAVNLAADKKIYILDEATSNIDAESEKIIMNRIKELAETRTVIVISHRLANVVPASRIYYMENGQIAEYGTHEELMGRNGGYAHLFRTQKQLEEGYMEVEA